MDFTFLDGKLDDLIKEVDKRSEELIKEFYEHLHEITATDPIISRTECFEGWILQKVAGIHVVLEKMARMTGSHE